jgi:uncharacterized protein YacL
MTTDGLQNLSWKNFFITAFSTAALGSILSVFDWLSRHFSLRALNVFILGSLLGYLFSLTFMACLDHLTFWTPRLLPASKLLAGIKFSLLLFGIYFGISLVARAADEIYMSIPLVRFRFNNNKKKDLLVDRSAVFDTRLLDIAGCGMFDQRLVIARHLIKELQDGLSQPDDALRLKCRKALDMIASLEMLPRLNIRFYETDFDEVKDPLLKMIKVARNIDADIITSTLGPSALTQIEDIRFINLQALASAMQPPITIGESIQLKICKVGKESSQGIGFLDDGSMVVVNHAGHLVGQSVSCNLLSIKRTMNGRLIFANLEDSHCELNENQSRSNNGYSVEEINSLKDSCL